MALQEEKYKIVQIVSLFFLLHILKKMFIGIFQVYQ